MTGPASPDSLLTLPPPALPEAELLTLVQRHYGLTGTLTRLTSERDLNHRLTTATGVCTVKLTNPAEPPEMTAFQTAALQHVAARAPALPVPRILATLNGSAITPTPHGALRVLTWLDGIPLHAAPKSPAQRRAVGHALARLTAALTDFTHPAADHILLWDIKQTPRIAPLLAAITDPALRAEATAFVTRFTTEIAPELAALPSQIVHADFNPHNLLTDAADPTRITGILDFGDMVRTPRICDLATAASYQIDAKAPLDSLADLLHGYTATLPLTEPELNLLFDLVTARMVTTLAITSWRAARYPENAPYILRNQPSAIAGLNAFRSIGRDRATARFLAASERSPA
ncbi:MAG: phosphotransferase [Tabrizicola sp.]|uniref:phosphotransferase n=1 Tax=Tabrizicola sp. TaxID=2005166 RepID=UPI00273245E6|nr:phosphotransferase [Tabrizicola sp.]MDP3262818.1 phosphotransferase [Tabrizicola sp.]MDP3649015.1 phosphotransferase [Paracoccaceae bacterium]MDZ4068711.1 phosphotransferase [Tabrizicola sp.]